MMKSYKQRYDRRKRRTSFLLLVFVLSMILSWSFSSHAEESRIKEEKTLEEQMQALTEAGFYAEAVRIFEKNQQARTPQSSILYFDSLLERNNPQKAYEFWLQEEELHSDTGALEKIVDRALTSSKEKFAWSVFQKEADALSEKEREKLILRIFSTYQRRKIKRKLVFAWVHDQACLQDDEGLYLVNSEGKAYERNHYDQLKAIKDGFLAIRQGQVLQLDKKGRYLRLLDPSDYDQAEEYAEGDEYINENKSEKEEEQGKNEREEQGKSERSRVSGHKGGKDLRPRPVRRGRKWAYALEDQLLMEADYSQLSPVSRQGIGYGFRQGSWEEIHFPALKK